jgi:purine catabolism regulator
VRTWLDRDRRGEDAASELHTHPNTLAYRLRFTELSGYDLAGTAGLAEVWLALYAARHLGDPHPI